MQREEYVPILWDKKYYVLEFERRPVWPEYGEQ